MRNSVKLIAGVVAATTLPGLSVVGCSDHPKSSTPTSGSTTAAHPGDYTRLLIKATDINAPEPFTGTPPVNNPNGTQGATVTFADSDNSDRFGLDEMH